MQNHYLIKRSPSFSNKGLIEKRSQKGKKYSETVISSTNRLPLLKDFNPGDMVYVAEKDWGIYASDQVVEISELFIASSLEDIIGYIVDRKKKEEVYWFDKLTRFHQEKQNKGGKPVEFKYQEYTINQKLLIRPIPLVAGVNSFQASRQNMMPIA